MDGLQPSMIWLPAPPGTVTLSGEVASYNDASAPYSAQATIKFDNDGNVYKYEGATSGSPSYVQVDTTNDWLRPTSAYNAGFQIYVTETSGTIDTYTINAVSATLDQWNSIAGDVILTNTQTSVGSNNCTMTVSIRYSGVTLASASYSCNASAGL